MAEVIGPEQTDQAPDLKLVQPPIPDQSTSQPDPPQSTLGQTPEPEQEPEPIIPPSRSKKQQAAEKARVAKAVLKAARDKEAEKAGSTTGSSSGIEYVGTVEPIISGLAESVALPLNDGEKRATVWLDNTIRKYGGDKILEVMAILVGIAIVLPRAVILAWRAKHGKALVPDRSGT